MAGIEVRRERRFLRPVWAKDYGDREHVLAGGVKIDATQFPREDNVLVKAAAAAAVGATAITVDALSGPIPANTDLRFQSGHTVRVTTKALAAATSIVVEPLQYAVADNEEAVFHGSGRVFIQSGTPVGRTQVEADAGTPFGPAADTGDIVYLLYHDIDDALRNNDADLYRHRGLVAVNALPTWATMSSAVKAIIRANYETTLGAD